MATTEKLEALRAKLAEAKQKEREVAAMPARLRAEFDALGERLMEHDLPVDGSPPPRGSEAGKLWRERHDVQLRLEGPWAQRLDRARAETAERESDLARFVTDHFGELVAAIEPDAEAAAQAVSVAVSELLGALDGWHEVEGRVVSLVRFVPGLTGQDLPQLPADGLRTDLRRLAAEPVPRPVPRSLYEVEAG